jgi:hypothetical protein
MKFVAIALSATTLLAAAPAAAQMVYGNYAGGLDAQMQMQMRIDRGIDNGVVSVAEARTLRAELAQLRRLDDRYSRGGFTGRERIDLTRRGEALGRRVQSALRTGGRYEEDERLTRDAASGAAWANRRGTLARDHRGPRFEGDFEIGQRAPAELIALPPEYRARYADDGEAYYRYNQGRVYRIERATDRIVRMLDPRG